jgi:dephospho-CoA kinase
LLRVGLTGGLACGKSTVGRMFAELGLHVLDADVIAHELLHPGTSVYARLVETFGPGILSGDSGSAIDRAKLAAAAFQAQPSRVDELNAIVHPAVIAQQDEWMQHIGMTEPSAIGVVEAALIYEAGSAGRFQKMIVVVAPVEAKIERYAQRVLAAAEAKRRIEPAERVRLDASARADAERRISAQMPDQEKARRADFVIDNSRGFDQLKAQVEAVVNTLKSAASSASR